MDFSERIDTILNWTDVNICIVCVFQTDNCRSNLLMLLLTKWLLLLLWSRYSSKRECDRSVHCLWTATWLSALTPDIEWTFQLDLLFRGDKSCRQNVRFVKAWQIVSQQARLRAIRYLLGSGEPVVTRFVTPCSTCFKGYEWSMCKPQTVLLHNFVECDDMGTRHACTGSMIMCKYIGLYW